MNDFEDRLRQWGTAQAAAAGDPPPLSVPQWRRRWHPLAAAAGVVLLAGGVAVAAGSGGDPAPGPVASPQPAADVPWADLPPNVQPSPTSTTTVLPASCRPADLRAEFGSQDAFTGGNLIRYVRLTSTAPGPCTLDAAVTAITAVLDRQRVTVPLYSNHLSYGPRKGVLRPGGEGYLVLSYNVSCNGTAEQPPNTRSYRSFRMTLGGVELPVAPGSLETGVLSFCSDSVATTRAGVDPEPVREADPAVDVLVSVDAPATVRAGEVLRYVVRVTNTGTVPWDLDPCPNFLQSLGKAEGRPSALHCAAAQPVPAHDSETFAMELVVPASTAPGETTLFWELEHSGAQGTTKVLVESPSDP